MPGDPTSQTRSTSFPSPSKIAWWVEGLYQSKATHGYGEDAGGLRDVVRRGMDASCRAFARREEVFPWPPVSKTFMIAEILVEMLSASNLMAKSGSINAFRGRE